MDDRSASIRMFLAAISALCSAMAMGCVIGWSGTALGSLKKSGSEPLIRTWYIDKKEYTNESDLEYSTWISSCITLGALAGSLVSGFIIQFAGGRKTLIGLGIPLTVGWACICFAKSFILIIVGRSITGFCSGVICSTAPGYVSDIVTPKTRGILGTGFQLLICVGQLYLICFGTFLEWNQLAYVSLVPVILCSVGMIFAPESPIRLVEKGEIVEAREVLLQIRGHDSDINGELKELQERVQANQRVTSSGFGILKRADVYHPAIIAIMLMVFQQFSGINAVMFYLKNIFEGGSSMDSNVAAIMVDGALVVATVASALVMDKFGRKVLLLISGIGHVLSLGMMGYYYKSIQPQNGWIPVACLMLFVVMFSFGYGPIPWMIVGEITPNEAMPLVSSLGSATNWLCAFIITKEFKALIDQVHEYGAYWLFAGCSLLSVLYTFFFVPETKHRSIEEMQRHFLRK